MKFNFYGVEMRSKTDLPTLIAKISAGVRREVETHFDRVDLNKMLTGGHENHMLLHVDGDSMDGVIADGDWVVMSRERPPIPNDVVVARLNGEFTIKRHRIEHRGRNGLFLVPANGSYATTEVTEADDYEILGVVVWILKRP